MQEWPLGAIRKGFAFSVDPVTVCICSGVSEDMLPMSATWPYMAHEGPEVLRVDLEDICSRIGEWVSPPAIPAGYKTIHFNATGSPAVSRY